MPSRTIIRASILAERVLKEVYGKPSLRVRMGATIPIGLIFREALGAETVFFSFSTADEDYHAPNEFFRLQRLSDGMKAWIRYWELLGQQGWRHAGELANPISTGPRSIRRPMDRRGVMKRFLRRIAVLALLGFALGIAGQAQALTRGGKMIYARNADSLFLDPVLNERNVDIWILSNLYDTLLEPTPDGHSVQPGLAESYQLSDDGLTFTAKLRANLKFADGSPITVDDVKWSLDRARDPKNGAWNFTLESINSITTRGSGYGGAASEASRSGADGGACHLQHLHHVPEAVRGRARRQ